MQTSIELFREAGHEIVMLLGHPNYYPRFGFVPASRFNIRWENEAPDAAFMVMGLKPGALDGVTGIMRYQPEFTSV